jgi:hypothetical protein
MSITLGQVAVPGNATIPVFLLPTGLSNFLVFQPTSGNPATVYLGSSANVSSANGIPVPVTPANSESYIGTGGGKQFYATTGSAVASTFHFLISTAS